MNSVDDDLADHIAAEWLSFGYLPSVPQLQPTYEEYRQAVGREMEARRRKFMGDEEQGEMEWYRNPQTGEWKMREVTNVEKLYQALEDAYGCPSL